MTKQEFKVTGENLLKKVRSLIDEGNIRRIIIKDEKGNKFLELPITIGILGAIAAPVLVAVGAVAALATKFQIEVVRKESPKKKKPSKAKTSKKK